MIAAGFALEESNVHAPNERMPAEYLALGVDTVCETYRRLGELARSEAVATFASPLAEELAEDVLERLLRYARIDTQGAYRVPERPSTEKQLELSRLLVEELRELGLEDARLTEDSNASRACPAPTVPRRSGSSPTWTRRPT